MNQRFPNRHCLIGVLLLWCWASFAAANEKIVHVIDFSGNVNGSAVSWLEERGFELQLDAKKLNPRFENDALVISADGEMAGLFGLQLKQQHFIHNVKRVEIVWGVNKYPQGANWNAGINSVPIAVMLSFGTEKLSSGLPFGIYAAPYFLSPFIGKAEEVDRMYVGKLWKKGGRYFCVASGNPPGTVITTDFEVDEKFRATFKHPKTPPITGIAFQANTNNTQGGAEAFIKKITFLSR